MPPASVLENLETSLQEVRINHYGYIYKTISLLDGMIYIGQRQGMVNLSYQGSGIHIVRAIEKYGKENFVTRVLISCGSKEDLNKTEIKLIHLHRKIFGRDKLYNISDGGEGWTKGVPLPEVTKQKIRNKLIGRHPTPEQVQNQIKAQTGKKFGPCPEERKLKISKTNTGKILSPETREAMSKAGKGRPSHRKGKTMTEETCEKMKQGHLGKSLSETHSQAIGSAVKAYYDRQRAEGKPCKVHTQESNYMRSETMKALKACKRFGLLPLNKGG